MHLIIKHKQIENILDLLFAFILVYFTRSMWSTIPSIHTVNMFLYALMVVVTVARILISGRKIKWSIIGGIVIITLYLLLFTLIRPINLEDYLRVCITTCLTILYISLPSRAGRNGQNVLFAYEKIILLFTLLSLFFWLMGSITGIVKPSGIVETSWSGSDILKKVDTYYYLYFTPQVGNLFSLKGVVRNSSIFVEAPVASYHLCLALMVELFINKKKNKLSILVLIAGIITSVSMTGYAIAVLAISFYVFFSKEDHSILRAIKVIILPIAILIVGIVLYNILQQRVGTGSGNTRIDDIVAGFKAWKDNILFGNGYGNAESYIKYMSNFRYFNKGFSNSIMQILAYGGIYLFIPYVIGFVVGLYRSLKQKDTFFFFILFYGMLVITVLEFQPLTIFMILFFLHKKPSGTLFPYGKNIRLRRKGV